MSATGTCLKYVLDETQMSSSLRPMTNPYDALVYQPTIRGAERPLDDRWHRGLIVRLYQGTTSSNGGSPLNNIVRGLKDSDLASSVPAMLGREFAPKVLDVNSMKTAHSLLAQELRPFAVELLPLLLGGNIAADNYCGRITVSATLVEEDFKHHRKSSALIL